MGTSMACYYTAQIANLDHGRTKSPAITGLVAVWTKRERRGSHYLIPLVAVCLQKRLCSQSGSDGFQALPLFTQQLDAIPWAFQPANGNATPHAPATRTARVPRA